MAGGAIWHGTDIQYWTKKEHDLLDVRLVHAWGIATEVTERSAPQGTMKMGSTVSRMRRRSVRVICRDCSGHFFSGALTPHDAMRSA